MSPLAVGYASGIQYLLRDEFTTLANPPLTSPRTAEPGPGILTLTQTDGSFAISDGKFRFAPPAVASYTTQNWQGASLARVVGRSFSAELTLNIASVRQYLGWVGSSQLDPTNAAFSGHVFLHWTSSGIFVRDDNVGPQVPDTYTNLTSYMYNIIMRSVGAHYFRKVGSGTRTLLWVSAIGSDATMKPSMINNAQAGSMDYVRVRDLGSPFDTDYGIASFHITSFTQSLGSELVTNGNFANWTLDNPDNWTVTGEVTTNPAVHQVGSGEGHLGVGTGQANFYSTTAGLTVSQNLGEAAGDVYEIAFDDSFDAGTGSLYFAIGGGLNRSVLGANGAVSSGRELITAKDTSDFRINSNNFTHDITLDNISVKKLTLNAQQVGTADAILDFGFTVPASPLSGQRIELRYRISDSINYWVAYLQRNAGGTAWDFRLDSISAGAATNRLAVTGVTADMIRVIVNGSLHDAYTKSGTTWTKRGSQVNVSHLDHATGVNTVYSTGTTAATLDSWPIRAASYDAALTLNPPTYVLLDRFYTSLPVNLPASRSSEPGAGLMKKGTDSTNLVRIAGGKVTSVGTPIVNFTDPSYYWTDNSGNGFPRIAGRVVMFKGLSILSSALRRVQVGLHSSATPTANIVAGFWFSATFLEIRMGSALPDVATYAVATYDLAIVEFANGYAWLIRGGIFLNWTLLFVNYSGSDATLWPMLQTGLTSGVSDYELAGVLISDLGSTLDSQADIALVDVTSFTQSAGSELLTDPGLEAWTSPTNATSYTESLAGTSTVNQETSSLHGGSNAARYDIDGSNSNANIAQVISGSVASDVWEISVWARSNPTAKTFAIATSGPTSGAITLTNVYAQYTALLRAGAANGNFQPIRQSAASSSIYLDDFSIKKLTLNAAVSITADSVIDFEFTVPASPVAGTEVHLLYRIQNAGEEFNNCWDAYLRRNDANSAWDFRLDSILAQARTNRISATGVSTPNAIKVICEGSNHDCYTRESNVWTKRGGTIAVAHMDARVLANTIYSTGTTATELRAYPRTGRIDTTPLVNVTVDGQTLGAELLTDPGIEAWTSATNATSYTESLSGTSTVNQETSSVHGGTSAVRYDIDGSNSSASIAQGMTGAVAEDIWEVSLWAKSTAAQTFNITSSGESTGAITSTSSYARYGSILRAGAVNSNFAPTRASATSASLFFDDMSVKKITPQALQVATADGVFELAFTLPVSPYARQRIQMRFRVQDGANYWVAYVWRNDANNAWNISVDSVVAGAATNRIAATGIGTVDTIRIRAMGSNVVAETGAAGVLTHRGVVSSSILQGAVLTTYVYSSGFTFGSLKHYKFIPAYTLLDNL